MTRSFLILAAGIGIASTAAAQTADSTSQARTRLQVTQGLDSRFKALDANADGSLTRIEIEAAEARARQAASAQVNKQAEEGFAKLDTDKSGQLSLAEFKAAAPTVGAGDPGAVLTRLDANKDGKITAQEFQTPTLAVFDRLDLNKDGALSAQERKVRRGSSTNSR